MHKVFTRATCRSWMQTNRELARERYTGEINLTKLAEKAAYHFEVEHTGGPLDDPDHWIWEIAISVSL